MKSLAKPPTLIRLTMDSVCIMLERPPKKGEKGKEDYWEEAKKLLANPNLIIKRLKDYDTENIPDKVLDKIKKFFD